MWVSVYNLSISIGTDRASDEVTSSFRKYLRQFSLWKITNSLPCPSCPEVYKNLLQEKNHSSLLKVYRTGLKESRVMVRNKDNCYNWQSSSPTPLEITWFISLFVQAYDTYKKHPEKTCRNKNNQTTFSFQNYRRSC